MWSALPFCEPARLASFAFQHQPIFSLLVRLAVCFGRDFDEELDELDELDLRVLVFVFLRQGLLLLWCLREPGLQHVTLTRLDPESPIPLN